MGPSEEEGVQKGIHLSGDLHCFLVPNATRGSGRDGERDGDKGRETGESARTANEAALAVGARHPLHLLFALLSESDQAGGRERVTVAEQALRARRYWQALYYSLYFQQGLPLFHNHFMR